MGNSDSSLNWSTLNCFEADNLEEARDFDCKNITQQIIWEYQRYIPSIGWGAGSNLLETDPGRWATHRRDRFGDTLQSVAPQIPAGYRVDLGWAIVVQKRKQKPNAPVKTSITDLFGWHYSNSFDSTSW